MYKTSGTVEDISSNLSAVNDTYNVNGEVEFTRQANDSIVVVFPVGVGVTVNVTAGIPNFVLSLPSSYKNQTQGLLGNYNGNSTDDFIPRNMDNSLPSIISDQEVHQLFGQTCKLVNHYQYYQECMILHRANALLVLCTIILFCSCTSWGYIIISLKCRCVVRCVYLYMSTTGAVTEEESLFSYSLDGASFEDFQHPDHQPIFLDELTPTAEQVEVCGGDQQCMYDYAQTGNAEVGLATMEVEQSTSTSQTLLGMLYV